MTTGRSLPLSKLNIAEQIAISGITTAAGAAGGTSIIDSALIGKQDYITNKAVFLISGPAQFEMRQVVSFNNITGEVGITPAFTDSTGAAVQIPAVTAYSLITTVLKQVMQPSIDIWSLYSAQVVVTTVAGNKALPSLTIVGIPSGATVLRVVPMVKVRTIENTNAAVNSLSGAQVIQCQKAVGGAWITAISFAGGEMAVPATSRDGGDVLIGNTDVTAQTPGNGAVMNFQMASALAAQNNLNFNDIQTGIRIYVSL